MAVVVWGLFSGFSCPLHEITVSNKKIIVVFLKKKSISRVNFELFIAQRIIKSKDYKSSISAPIIKIAIAAIVIGMVMMLVAIATGLGLQQKIREKISAFNGDIIISKFDSNRSDDSQIPISLEQSFYPVFPNQPQIKHIQATASKTGIIRTAENYEGIVAKGVGADFNWSYFEEFLVAGRLPNYQKELNNEILLSEYLANRLQLQVGDRVVTLFSDEQSSRMHRMIGFDLVGIYNSGFLDFDRTHLITDIRQIRRLNRWEADQVGAFEIFVQDFNQIDQTGEAVYYAVPSDLDTVTIRQQYSSIFEWLDLFDFNIYLIIGIMILVAGINMITALLVLILERTQMIGIFKSLGASHGSIRKIFLYNAMYLISIGLFWGNLIGIGLLLIQKYFKLFPLNPDIYYVSEAPVFIHWGFIAALNVGTFVLCLLMLLVPSYLVTKISPVQAIKFE